MQDQRRSFLKKTLGASAVVAAVGVSAIANESGATIAGSNGVVKGKSKKKEILYKKTANWDAYYHAAV
ncbi:formate dehydrogenase accessory protein FdhE [Sulfurospirillum diekertiae]|uniref:Formate dehydrogenase accessory protein FdhE n=1 Tax=Sulfurospirillum diekertiae TaxID=1854492 RepID=A0A290HYE6_9BACT|nr:Tat pathway signal protein [Sulfurospirillum diekertiae]ATB70680.1 formate dehydrogenase accessory protein FdhE [Sulfurospirillum diekertiae]